MKDQQAPQDRAPSPEIYFLSPESPRIQKKKNPKNPLYSKKSTKLNIPNKSLKTKHIQTYPNE